MYIQYIILCFLASIKTLFSVRGFTQQMFDDTSVRSSWRQPLWSRGPPFSLTTDAIVGSLFPRSRVFPLVSQCLQLKVHQLLFLPSFSTSLWPQRRRHRFLLQIRVSFFPLFFFFCCFCSVSVSAVCHMTAGKRIFSNRLKISICCHGSSVSPFIIRHVLYSTESKLYPSGRKVHHCKLLFVICHKINSSCMIIIPSFVSSGG